MKNIGRMGLFLAIGILMPVAIWVAAAVALWGRKPLRRAEEPILQT